MSYDASYQGWFYKHLIRIHIDAFFNHLSYPINFLPTGSGAITSCEVSGNDGNTVKACSSDFFEMMNNRFGSLSGIKKVLDNECRRQWY